MGRTILTRTILFIAALLTLGTAASRLGADEPTLEQRMVAELQPRVLAAMLKLSPPEKHRPPPGFEETPDEALARYESIAADITVVAVENSDGNAWNALLAARDLTATGWHESGYAKDVDKGVCSQAPGYKGRCDHDGKRQKAWGLWQNQLLPKGLRNDRRAQAREALAHIRGSRHACASNPPSEQLAAYAGGVCDLLIARAASRSLWGAIQRTAAVGL